MTVTSKTNHEETPKGTTTTTTVTAPSASAPALLSGMGRTSANITCPHCNKAGSTRTTQEPDGMTFLVSLFLCLICLPLAFIPCCIPSCQAVQHSCPHCKRVVGKVGSFQ
uniref:LITAF domain-containing protein n=1 Tax=Cyclophora tenuis TaxID=216820 RepID=A0A7S1GKS4_CYCTE|mmetsp:Transcript_18425/g.31457  ORF Transcript_18425/g.31457 Transcript_18425/m.31457 type:complete len:110 (+) Transcript_18425:107-436(+)